MKIFAHFHDSLKNAGADKNLNTFFCKMASVTRLRTTRFVEPPEFSQDR